MNKSLQDQLLGAGLVDGKKAKQAAKEARKAKKQQGKKKGQEAQLTEAQIAARQAQQEKLQRDQELNQQRKLEADKKAIAAQVIQMVKHCKLDRRGAEVEYNFTDNNKIKKMLVTQPMYDEIVRGRLCIVRYSEGYELIPKPVAEKIRERDADSIVVSNKKPTTKQEAQDSSAAQDAVQSDEDYYAQFEIPDDLTW